MLIGARFIQAVGGSMLNPVAMSIITTVFTGRVERARAVGVWGAVVGISTAIGPMVGGVLIDALGWQSVFWINLPICAVALALTTLYVPESKSRTARGIDPLGQVLAVVVMFTLVFGLIEHRPEIFGITAVALAGFLYAERRHRSPFIDLRFFRSVPFAAATVTAICAFAGLGAFLFSASLYLQGVRHYSAVHTGLLYLPMALGMLICSPLSGRLVGRFGTRPSLVAAGILMTTAAALLTTLRPDTPVWQLVVMFAIFGAGFGTVNPPITTAAVSGMPMDRAGAASFEGVENEGRTGSRGGGEDLAVGAFGGFGQHGRDEVVPVADVPVQRRASDAQVAGEHRHVELFARQVQLRRRVDGATPLGSSDHVVHLLIPRQAVPARRPYRAG